MNVYKNQTIRRNGGTFVAQCCTIYGDSNAIRGNANTINGDSNMITGNGNTITGDSNAITGNGNTINGDSNSINGNANSIRGDSNYSNGTENTVEGENNAGVDAQSKQFGSIGFGNSFGLFNNVNNVKSFKSVNSFQNNCNNVNSFQNNLNNVNSSANVNSRGSCFRPNGQYLFNFVNTSGDANKPAETVVIHDDDDDDKTRVEKEAPLQLPDADPHEPEISADDAPDLCIVCFKRKIRAVIVDCGHSQLCVSCVRECALSSGLCPTCRTPIKHAIKLFS